MNIPGYTDEQLKLWELFQKNELSADGARSLLTPEVFYALKAWKPPAPPAKERGWDDFYFTILKVPCAWKWERLRWALYGAVTNKDGKVIYSWMTEPTDKQRCLGKIKIAAETIFEELDLRRDLQQLHAATVGTLINEKIVIHPQVYSAPWIRISRRPRWQIAIGAKAVVKPKKSGKNFTVSITEFDAVDEVKIAGGEYKSNMERSIILERWTLVYSMMPSIDTTPLFNPLFKEMKTRFGDKK